MARGLAREGECSISTLQVLFCINHGQAGYGQIHLDERFFEELFVSKECFNSVVARSYGSHLLAVGWKTFRIGFNFVTINNPHIPLVYVPTRLEPSAASMTKAYNGRKQLLEDTGNLPTQIWRIWSFSYR